MSKQLRHIEREMDYPIFVVTKTTLSILRICHDAAHFSRYYDYPDPEPQKCSWSL